MELKRRAEKRMGWNDEGKGRSERGMAWEVKGKMERNRKRRKNKKERGKGWEDAATRNKGGERGGEKIGWKWDRMKGKGRKKREMRKWESRGRAGKGKGRREREMKEERRAAKGQGK